MPSQKLVPVPSAVRPFLWVLRAFGVVLGLGSLYLAVLAIGQGRWWLSAAVLIVGGGFVALTWMHPLGRWMPPTLVGVFALLAVLARSWFVALLFLGTAVLVWWSRKPGTPPLLRMKPANVFVAPPDAVMKNAHAFVEEFTRAGLKQVGALGFSIGPVKVTASLLLSVDGLSYASVTDAIVSVTSLFPEGRSLVTLNSNLVSLASTTLLNEVRGGSPAELMRSHAAALAALAERGHYPVPVAATELAQIAMDRERAAIAWVAARRNEKRGAWTAGPLVDQEDLDERIAIWHGSDERLHPE